METLLKQLQQLGVHTLKNNDTIMLEILNNPQPQAIEIDKLINKLITHRTTKKLMLECPNQMVNQLNLTKANMKITGERVVYTRSLMLPEPFAVPNYEVWSIDDPNSIAFLAEVMQKSFADTQYFLQQMLEELPSQAEKMFTVYLVDYEPVGVVFPHIEPHTASEGRLFWIGLHPLYVGKGLGKALHTIGLHRLKQDFNAHTYVGITQVENVAMRNIMRVNGCNEIENTLITLQDVRD
jgi:RimJ/RimL family protein N-acetyltransferase